MEDLISGLLNTALDAASSLVHQPNNVSPTSSLPPTPECVESSVDRSTWAEVVGGQEEHFHNSAKNDNSHSAHPWQNARQDRQHQQHQSSTSETRYKYQVSGSDYGDSVNWKKEEGDGWHPTKNYKQHPPPPEHYHKLPDEQSRKFKKHPSKQQYAEPVDSGINTEPTQEELKSISTACNRLWELDLNRLTPGQEYEINCGEGKRVYEKEDMAFNSLFRFVKRDVFQRATYTRFYALLDNYTANEEIKESCTDEERQEQIAFIEEISRTGPIQYLFKYLVSREIVSQGFLEFKKHLHSLWFDCHNRGGVRGSSSAFEHVFVGEIKNGAEKEVSGFHNWIKFYVEEAAGRIDYQGYILPRRRSHAEPDAHSQLLSVQFMWNGLLKPISSIFVGVSPEFEMALYTLCFYGGQENNHVDVGPYRVNIKCYRFGKDKMGSTFPIDED